MKTIKILGIVGSLRKDSYNLALLKAAQNLLPPNTELEIFSPAKLPLFDQDGEMQPTPAVIDLKNKIRNADAILFSSPEYNYSIPGVLKNAIDLASRPYGDSAWAGKPAAIMGASIGNVATARMQYHLRQVMVFLDMHPLNRPEVMVAMAQNKTNENGELTDDETKTKISEMLVALVDWTKKLASLSA
ncbi:MAG: NAD(P)H-dependent oxidoreductase [Patescibacteria group bacterium]